MGALKKSLGGPRGILSPPGALGGSLGVLLESLRGALMGEICRGFFGDLSGVLRVGPSGNP
eukprot:6757013-Pyramimonas_sp.AAC.1